MIENFIKQWFPKNKRWDNIAKFILESGIEIAEEVNTKWLSGYTNISKCSKPHHKDNYKRYMEEQMFMLHDVVHQIFTLDTNCGREEYVKRQIYGELFTFYLTEYILPREFEDKHQRYIGERGCYDLMSAVIGENCSNNIINTMYDIFINGVFTQRFSSKITDRKLESNFIKYSKMFKEDLQNSNKNWENLPENIRNYCIVGETSDNHIDFFEAVGKGCIKNIKRDFDLKLPNNWI